MFALARSVCRSSRRSDRSRASRSLVTRARALVDHDVVHAPHTGDTETITFDVFTPYVRVRVLDVVRNVRKASP